MELQNSNNNLNNKKIRHKKFMCRWLGNKKINFNDFKSKINLKNCKKFIK